MGRSVIANRTYDEVANELYTRRGEAVLVPSLSVSVGDWTPMQNCCHDNVDRWITERPGTKAVRGWLIVDTSSNGYNSMFFDAHSVVELEDGTLIDITPKISPQFPYKFLRHNSADDFEGFKKLARLQYPPIGISTPYCE